jgi:hypothetical protein
MKTDEVVAALARSAAPVDAAAVGRRFALTLAGGVLLSLAAMLLFLGPRPDWRNAMELPMYWVKLAFPAAMAAMALLALWRLAHPGRRPGGSIPALGAPVLAVWALAATVLAAAHPADRSGLLLGVSAATCPFVIAALSVPVFVATFRALRQLAPTRLALTGTLAGLFAGAVAASAYALYCVEMQAPFLAVWYVLGMAIPAAAGALLGRRLLRW